MLVPPGLSKKERAEYDKVHVPKAKEFINVGPKGGLRPPGGSKAPTPAPATKKVLKDKVEVKEKRGK